MSFLNNISTFVHDAAKLYSSVQRANAFVDRVRSPPPPTVNVTRAT